MPHLRGSFFVLLPIVFLWGCGEARGPAAADPFDPDVAAEGLTLGPPVFDVAPAWSGPDLPFPPAEHPWDEVRRGRIGQLLGPAMERAGVDAWVVFVRENMNDPLARHVGGENAGGLAALLFFREGGAGAGASPVGVSSLALSPGGEATALRDVGLHDSVAVLSGESAWEAAEITAALELEAYARIIPGQTTDADVAQFLKRRMAQLGVADGWSPAQNPNVNSGPDRGHSHATDRVIRPGDVIQTNFGIRVWDMWVTDIQQFAYVLAPGETAPPAHIQRYWETARAGSCRPRRVLKKWVLIPSR